MPADINKIVLEPDWVIDQDVLNVISADGTVELRDVDILKANDPELLDWSFKQNHVDYNCVRALKLDKDKEFFQLFGNSSEPYSETADFLQKTWYSSFPLIDLPFSASNRNRHTTVKDVQVNNSSRVGSAFVSDHVFQLPNHGEYYFTLNIFAIKSQPFTFTSMSSLTQWQEEQHPLGIYREVPQFFWFSPGSDYMTLVDIADLFDALDQHLEYNNDIIFMILNYLQFNPKLIEFRAIMGTSSPIQLGVRGVIDEKTYIKKAYSVIDQVQSLNHDATDYNDFIPCAPQLPGPPSAHFN